MAWYNESRRHSLASKGVKTAVEYKPFAKVPSSLKNYKDLSDKRDYLKEQLDRTNSLIKKNPYLLSDYEVQDFLKEHDVGFSKNDIDKMSNKELNEKIAKLYSLAELTSYKVFRKERKDAEYEEDLKLGFIRPENVDAEQLRMGIKVEMEHTNDKRIAEEIALDHLAEIPDYYTRLSRMEREAKVSMEHRKKGEEIGILLNEDKEREYEKKVRSWVKEKERAKKTEEFSNYVANEKKRSALINLAASIRMGTLHGETTGKTALARPEEIRKEAEKKSSKISYFKSPSGTEMVREVTPDGKIKIYHKKKS